jgi:hypothetical protein
MPRYFTHYWNKPTWAEEYAKPDHERPFHNIHGGQFFERKVKPGDYIYAIGVHTEDLYLLSRNLVAQVLRNTGPDHRWPEKVVVDLSGSSTSKPHFNHLVPRHVAFTLRFISPDGKDRLTPTPDGGIDPNAVRMMRELAEPSAKLLDQEIDSYEALLAQEQERTNVLDEEEVSNGTEPAIEGARIRVEVNRYERDPELRLNAIRLHGTRCQVCHFSFEEVYGERGAGYIEVHHLKPLSSHRKAGETRIETDVAVLCANCHRMIHRRKEELLTLDQLRSLIRSNPACARQK